MAVIRGAAATRAWLAEQQRKKVAAQNAAQRAKTRAMQDRGLAMRKHRSGLKTGINKVRKKPSGGTTVSRNPIYAPVRGPGGATRPVRGPVKVRGPGGTTRPIGRPYRGGPHRQDAPWGRDKDGRPKGRPGPVPRPEWVKRMEDSHSGVTHSSAEIKRYGEWKNQQARVKMIKARNKAIMERRRKGPHKIKSPTYYGRPSRGAAGAGGANPGPPRRKPKRPSTVPRGPWRAQPRRRRAVRKSPARKRTQSSASMRRSMASRRR